MEYKYIFNNEGNIYLGNLLNAGKMARRNNCDFVYFNGCVYYVDYKGYCYKTSINKIIV